MTDKKNTYAEKFFGKMTPGDAFGNGFIGEIEKSKKEKPIKSFVPLLSQR